MRALLEYCIGAPYRLPIQNTRTPRKANALIDDMMHLLKLRVTCRKDETLSDIVWV